MCMSVFLVGCEQESVTRSSCWNIWKIVKMATIYSTGENSLGSKCHMQDEILVQGLKRPGQNGPHGVLAPCGAFTSLSAFVLASVAASSGPQEAAVNLTN